MPTRLLREGILTSERVSKLSVGAELFFRKAMSVTDDYGRFEADPKLLRARLYPRQLEQTSEEMISGFLRECCRLGLMRMYQVENTKYLQLERFGQRARTASRFPDPEGHWLRAPVRNVRANGSRVPADDSKVLPQSESESDAESDAEHLDDSAAFSINRTNGTRKISRAGRAASKTRPVASPGATAPRKGVAGENKPPSMALRAAASYSAAELATFRQAIRTELGEQATEAEIDEKFAAYTARRRQA